MKGCMVAGSHLIILPFSREHPLVGALQKTFIQKRHNADIIHCADHPACRLQYFIHSRVLVSIIKTVFRLFIKIPADDLSFITDLRQTGSHDDRTDEPVLF